MASIDSKLIFITTSPRTPAKMIPEIELLNKYFAGKKWNNEIQISFMEKLREENFFSGEGAKDPAFSARDRINRAPKALGFVKLKPVIELTPAGKALITSKRKEEIFLRQLLKFQIPSPYHKPSTNAATFCVKPYLELFRLIRHFGSLKFDELMIFGLQLVDYRLFDSVSERIEKFRIDKANSKDNYKKFRNDYLQKELKQIFQFELQVGKTKTRESADNSVKKFLATKMSNIRDYTDACVRYLRATGMINVSHIGKSVSIIPEKIDEVDFFLEHTDRMPKSFETEQEYAEYLGSASTPKLLTDDKEKLVMKLREDFPDVRFDEKQSVQILKDLLFEQIENRKAKILETQVAELKNYKAYDDIQNTFAYIKEAAAYDAPLLFEWNAWRAMTMLDGGSIKANLKFDDFGNPMSTAQGNMADIICDYGDFYVAVEVTMQAGQRQYETESEPVSRHLAKLKKETEKEAFCLFIAPTINEACVAHFYTLYKTNIKFYGGYSSIVPLPLDIFQKMVEDSFKASYTPEPKHIKRFFEKTILLANSTDNEENWFAKVKETALNWLGL